VGLLGKDIAMTRYIGQVYADQLSSIREKRDILQRIGCKCENCGNNEYYNIYETSRHFRILNIPLLQYDTVWYFSCPEWNLGFKLVSDEFKALEKIAVLNSRYLEGIITKFEFEESLKSILL
jgi:hypothetical protein